MLNPVGGVESPNLGKKASLSNETWRQLITLTNEAHKMGAQQKAYPKTAKALTTPSGYQGQAMTKRAPNIAIHGVSRARIGSRNALAVIQESAKATSK